MNIFDTVRVSKPRRSKFNLSHEKKLTFSMGNLYPILCQEVLPGDSFRVQSSVMIRFLALLAPVMHKVDVTVHYFFVPNRLIWNNWQSFITGGVQGLDAPVAPYWTPQSMKNYNLNAMKTGGLLDYLGFPVMKKAGTYNSGYDSLQFSSLPARAYTLIWDTFYRDQTLAPTVISPTFAGDGDANVADYSNVFTIRKRAWEKDYFTSALPFTQRGANVSTPLQFDYNSASKVQNVPGGAYPTGSMSASAGYVQANASNSAIDVTSHTSISLAALRLSEHLQKWLERNARGGSRYIEQLASHFGVISSDARLQRPEYLGGGKQPVMISEVLQSAPAAGGSTPLGQMAGHGISVGSTNQFSRSFEEHGFIMGLLSVIPKTAYQTAMDPLWSDRKKNTQYYWPEFANLGEQAVGNSNVYTDFGDASGVAGVNGVFGYQSRYAEYKFNWDTVHGDMRESLAYWHFGRQFGSRPSLNSSFVESVPRTDPFAVSGTDLLVAQVYHKIDALRPIPYFDLPSL